MRKNRKKIPECLTTHENKELREWALSITDPDEIAFLHALEEISEILSEAERGLAAGALTNIGRMTRDEYRAHRAEQLERMAQAADRGETTDLSNMTREERKAHLFPIEVFTPETGLPDDLLELLERAEAAPGSEQFNDEDR